MTENIYQERLETALRQALGPAVRSAPSAGVALAPGSGESSLSEEESAHQAEMAKMVNYPAPEQDNTRITSHPGMRNDPLGAKDEHGQAKHQDHKGTDIGMPVGHPVYSVDGGEVIVAGESKNKNNGIHVVVKHSGGKSSWYLHLSEVRVRPGQSVSAGTLVGLAGSTGRSTGPHLHLEIHVGSQPRPPTQTEIDVARYGLKQPPSDEARASYLHNLVILANKADAEGHYKIAETLDRCSNNITVTAATAQEDVAAAIVYVINAFADKVSPEKKSGYITNILSKLRMLDGGSLSAKKKNPGAGVGAIISLCKNMLAGHTEGEIIQILEKTQQYASKI